MSKQIKVQQIQPDADGPVYGQVSNPADFMKAEIFSHGHSEINARDFIVGKCATNAVCGFNYSLLGGLQFRVVTPGQVITVDGKSYEMIGDAPSDFALEPSDENNPRTDLVVAKLEIVDAAEELRPFVRLRTQPELEDLVDPYPPEQFTQPTEIHVRAVIQIKTGTPAEQPSMAELESDEEPLYAIRVPANATQIDVSAVVDLRHLVASNCELQDRIRKIKFPPIPERWPAAVIDLAPGSPGYKAFGPTDQDAWDNLAQRVEAEPTTGAALRPEILRPELAPYHAESGKLSSSGSVESSVPTVRIPYPSRVAFATGVFGVDPNAFVDQSLNPRLLNTDPDAGDNAIEHVVNYSLAVVETIETDGGGDWGLLSAVLPSARYCWPGGQFASARDDRYIEVMGGQPGGGTDWYTFDTIAQSFAARAFSGDVPTSSIIFVIGCGNGKMLIAARHFDVELTAQFYGLGAVPAVGIVSGKVYDQAYQGALLAGATVTLSGDGYEQSVVTGLNGAYQFAAVPAVDGTPYVLSVGKAGYVAGDIALSMPSGAIAGSGYDVVLPLEAVAGGSGLDWFLVDAVTGASTKFATNARPDSAGDTVVWGALVQEDVIFLTVSSSANRFWIYHADSNSFENFVPGGQGPLFTAGKLPLMGICFYRPGEAVIFQAQASAGNDNSDNRATIIFSYSTRNFRTENIAMPASSGRLRLAMANVNGRVYVVNGPGTPAQILELTPGVTPLWKTLSTSLPMRHLPGVASLFSNGLPKGGGFFFGGQDTVTLGAKSDVWRFAAGGIIETLCGGVAGITLGPGTRSATLRVADFQLPWQVARILITLRGSNLLQGRVKVMESFDDGAHLQEIPINANTIVLYSNAAPNRQLFITLTGTDAVKPCLSQSTETFEQEGGGGLGMVYVVYDCPVGTTYLYMDDRGKISSEGAAVETTKTKAILHRVIKNGGSAPTLFDFLNKPWYGRKYEGGAKSGGVDPTFANDLAVLPSDIECWKVAADGTVHLLADCTLVFDGNNTVTGLANGEGYRVHLAG